MLMREKTKPIEFDTFRFDSDYFHRYMVSDYISAVMGNEAMIISAYELANINNSCEDFERMHEILQRDVSLLEGYTDIFLIDSQDVQFIQSTVILPTCCTTSAGKVYGEVKAPLNGQLCSHSLIVLSKGGAIEGSVVLYQVKDAFTNYVDFDIESGSYIELMREFDSVAQFVDYKRNLEEVLIDPEVDCNLPYFVARSIAFDYVTGLIKEGYRVLGDFVCYIGSDRDEYDICIEGDNYIKLSNIRGDVDEFNKLRSICSLCLIVFTAEDSSVRVLF